jgi:NAD(P)H-dependent FMN reductase
MPHVEILSASVRKGRSSHRVALFFEKFIASNEFGTTGILDLNEYQFPIFEERLKFQSNPAPATLEFASRIKKADAVIIVTPEYNGSFPASIKNVVDLLTDEWFRKPIGIATVSSGDFAGTQALIALQFVLWKIKAWTVPSRFTVGNVEKTFDASGNPTDADKTNKIANGFLHDILWCVEANKRMALAKDEQ